VLIKTMSLLA